MFLDAGFWKVESKEGMVPDSCQHIQRCSTPGDLDVHFHMNVTTIVFEPEKMLFRKQNHDPNPLIRQNAGF